VLNISSMAGENKNSPDGVIRIVEGCREPSHAQHRLRPWRDGHPRQCIAPGAIPHATRYASVLTPEIEKQC
jgi:hypothetical protein